VLNPEAWFLHETHTIRADHVRFVLNPDASIQHETLIGAFILVSGLRS